MLTDMHLESYFESINLPQKGHDFVRRVRGSDPSRSVTEGNLENVSSVIYSEKMGHTIQSESSTGEYPAIYEYEFEPEVLEYWEQLPSVKVTGYNKSGRKTSWKLRADFLLLTKRGVIVDEIKSDNYINKKISEGHPAWYVDDQDVTHYLPAEEYFLQLGIEYRIRKISSFNKKLLSNRRLLMSSRQEDSPSPKIINKVKSALTQNFSMTMKELVELLKLTDVTPLIQMIDKGEMFCEIDQELLSDYENIHLALTKEISMQARSLRMQDRMATNLIGIEVNGLPSCAHAESALKKLNRIEQGEKSRSVRRWIKQIEEGKSIGLSPFESLLPRYANSGRREERFSDEEIVIFQKAVDHYYANERRSNVTSAYIRYRKYMQENHPALDFMCESTFRRRLRKLDQKKIAYKRGGKRMMHANSTTTALETRSLKYRVPFQRAHIDHTKVKCFLVWGTDGRTDFCGKPWLTLLIDEATDMILGYHFSFASPSRMADACVLRDCVRRYEKLPEEVIADHGSDFKSAYFRSLLASEKVTLTFRPTSCSKAGSEVERVFNEFLTQWLTQRDGNTANRVAARAVDGAFSSKRMAVFDPEDFLWEFDQFVAHRNSRLRGAKTQTIEMTFNKNSNLYACVGRKVQFDERFIVATAVESNHYTIERNDIKIDHIRYSHPALKSTRVAKTKVEVRTEPENPYIVYAFIGGKWVSCAATGAVEFMERTSISKRVETLKIRGAGSLRAYAKRHAQDDLAERLNKADERLKKAKEVGWLEVEDLPNTEDTEVSINIFEQLANAEVQRLSTSTWNQP